MTVIDYLLERFWNEAVWLPENVTWADLRPNEKIQYADHNHLYYPLPFAVVLLVLRVLLERFIASLLFDVGSVFIPNLLSIVGCVRWNKFLIYIGAICLCGLERFCYMPIGIHLGIKNVKHNKVLENKELEKLYKSGKKVSHKEIEAAAKQEKMTERQVERWLRNRKAADRPTTLKKFCENSFRFTYYVFSFIFGLVVLWDKPWLWNIKYCWYEYPHQSVSNDIWWYYMISLSFYWSLTMSHFFDVKHKDFWQMFIHHIATIMLMAFSWVCNMHRIGSLVLVVHDCADIFLEAAKMAKYAKRQKVCDALFVIFTIIWIVTRLGIYPFRIIRNTLFEAPQMVAMFPAYYIFNSLLLLLLGLHIFWTYLILKIAYNACLVGQMEGDIRSSTNDNSDEDSPSTNVTENGVKKTN